MTMLVPFVGRFFFGPRPHHARDTEVLIDGPAVNADEPDCWNRDATVLRRAQNK